jgi:hypothetical protein
MFMHLLIALLAIWFLFVVIMSIAAFVRVVLGISQDSKSIYNEYRKWKKEGGDPALPR